MRPLLSPIAPLAAAVALLGCAAPALADGAAADPAARAVLAPLPAVAVPRVEVVDDVMQRLPTFWQRGRLFVLGEPGQRYRIHIVNPTGNRFEAVVSVDGLDVIDGRTASLQKRGYIVPAWGDVLVDGWRTSFDSVAAFRFSSVRDSYAARTSTDRNVGVVGVALFAERAPAFPAVAGPSWIPPRTATEAPSAGARTPAPSPATAGAADATAAAARARPGLGTRFGEGHESRVELTTFVRASTRPATLVEMRYDDRAGLLARGIPVPPRDDRDAENALRDAAQPFPGVIFAQPPP